MSPRVQRSALVLLNNLTLVLFVLALLIFAQFVTKFLHPANLINILSQASATAIVAIGMTFVLLTAGVDLSVGAIMFVVAALAGKLILGGAPMPLALTVALIAGVAFGILNAFCVVRLRIIAFIVTLATLYLGRGFALWLTKTRAMNLPEEFVQFGSARLAGVPMPVMVTALILVLAHVVLTQTPFGRQVYAVGQDLDAAKKAGIKTGRLLAAVYVISGLCAAIGGMVSLAQLGAVSPTFGNQKEFAAIAAAVLGGTSLFGGRGHVFPGTILGAVLIQTVENGLVMVNADPYLYPLITSAIIFLAVLIDSLRTGLLARLSRRKIRPDQGEVFSDRLC